MVSKTAQRISSFEDSKESKDLFNDEKEQLNNLDPIWNWSNIRWGWVILLSYLHIEAFRFIWISICGGTGWKHWLVQIIWAYMGALGIVAGSHRLWSHRCYKVKLPLRLILVFFQTISGQTSIWRWSKDHRLHHKFSETNADPHNSKRGAFFAHVGWLFCPEHEMVTKKFKTIDMSDLEADPLVMFQYRYYTFLVGLVCFTVPTFIPYWFLEETLETAWSGTIFRYVTNINAVFCINSWAHIWGNRPYDKNISPTESRFLSILTCGEGWHNYHHTFSWDYKAAELGHYRYNFCTAFIDFFAWIGWAYDLKTVPWKFVLNRIKRTGDGSYDNYKYHDNEGNESYEDNNTAKVFPQKFSENHNDHQHNLPGNWGWGDKDIPQEDIEITEILCRQRS